MTWTYSNILDILYSLCSIWGRGHRIFSTLKTSPMSHFSYLYPIPYRCAWKDNVFNMTWSTQCVCWLNPYFLLLWCWWSLAIAAVGVLPMCDFCCCVSFAAVSLCCCRCVILALVVAVIVFRCLTRVPKKAAAVTNFENRIARPVHIRYDMSTGLGQPIW